MDMVDILGLLLMLSMTQLGNVRTTKLPSFLIQTKSYIGISYCKLNRCPADNGL